MPAPPPSAAAAPATPAQAEREALRRQHLVRELTPQENGTGVDQLPGGVYGFTYTPGCHDSPLFRERKHSTFEVHKLADGEVALIGFVPEETLGLIQAGGESAALRLHPAPTPEAPHLAVIPSSRIARIKEHSTRDDGALRLDLGPRQEQQFIN